MLIELKVSQFAIIENVQLNFQDGLNILSGETGAGKSILLKSLSLIMGSKAQSDWIRTGHKSATIEGCFDLTTRADILDRLMALDIPVDENLLTVRRVIGHNGRSRIYLNNTICTLTNLKEIVAPLVEVAGKSTPLIEMTGQHDSKYLMSRASHIEMLDHYVGATEQRKNLASLYEELQNLKKQTEELATQSQQREQQLDFLRFQVEEIENLELSEGDEVQIENAVKKLQNVDRISHFIGRTTESVYSSDHSIISQLSQIRSQGEELGRYDDKLAKSVVQVNEAAALLSDFVYELREYRDQLSTNPQALETESERLNQLRKLQKKFGTTAAEILANQAAMKKEIEEHCNADAKLQELSQREIELNGKIEKLAAELHQRRISGGTLLGESVNQELSDLNMKGVCFEVAVDKSPRMSATGFSQVEFLTRASKKEPARPLAKVASGGELSRLLLSLKRVIGQGDYPRTYLFDEVDAGVSGQTAEKVGRKLKSIARGQQVICVTHLPQVAAFGDVHFYIEKDPQEAGTKMKVDELSSKTRTAEIARLISGEKVTTTSIAHAEQLLSDSRV